MTSNINSDHYIQTQIDDTVQCLKFIPISNSNYLATGGWDNKLRVFNINYNIINQGLPQEDAQISSHLELGNQHNSPIFSLSWEGSTGRIFTGCADGSINYVDLQKNSSTILGRHKNTCKEVIYPVVMMDLLKYLIFEVETKFALINLIIKFIPCLV